MSADTNLVRRRFLIGATSVVGGAGVVGAAVPFVRAWTPSAKARALGAPVRIDVSKVSSGEMLGPIPSWRGQPVFIVYRSPELMATLNEQNDTLADPASTRKQQPDYATNPYRARDSRPELGVYVGLCTHLGCSPKYHGEIKPEEFKADWKGGFFCPCHGSMYDIAGRVFKNVPAAANLLVPPWYFESDSIIVVGLDGGTT